MTTAAEYLPERITLTNLQRAIHDCRGCQLYRRATQAVFGEGLVRSRMMLVGEQPGDQEDQQGRPFVGPAGKLLDTLLDEAGIARSDAYVTNVVKHFKWEPRGKRRFHARPSAREINACRPWLEAEIEALEPRVLVCLGATAAQALLGNKFRITRQHGELLSSHYCEHTLATYHPSAVLRAPDEERRHQLRSVMIADLKQAAKALG